MEHFDVIIVGAGLSGIGAAYHLQQECPDKSLVLLESRQSLGGTWDLFRYPGIRSDSDMNTFGYDFKPWGAKNAISEGGKILDYLRETAEENGIDQKIRYGHEVVGANWEGAESRWTLRIRRGEVILLMSCSFLLLCSGYYDYEEGYTPQFAGSEDFAGRIVHPQKWTPDIDYRGKKVIVIGSGATAITLVPAMAKEAAHVYMLQRSPSYVISVPGEDKVAEFLHKVLPRKAAHFLVKWKNVLRGMYFFWISRKKPDAVRKFLKDQIRKEMGRDFDVDTHFHPDYNPWDQRVCVVPDNDLFKAIKEGKASIVTDHIGKFVPEGIRLKSGEVLEGDLIVTATGLKLKFAGGIRLEVNGQELKPSEMVGYKGLMFKDVPNLAGIVGYTNASWTLKADLVSKYICRLLNYMDRKGFSQAVPRSGTEDMETEPLIDFSSGYVVRGRDIMPRQGAEFPWKLHQNYIKDSFILKYSKVNDKYMEFKS